MGHRVDGQCILQITSSSHCCHCTQKANSFFPRQLNETFSLFDICHHDMTDDWKKWKALSNTQRLNYSYSCTFVWLEGWQYCWRGKLQWWKRRSQPNSIQKSHRASREPPFRMEWGRSAKSQLSWNDNMKTFKTCFTGSRKLIDTPDLEMDSCCIWLSRIEF